MAKRGNHIFGPTCWLSLVGFPINLRIKWVLKSFSCALIAFVFTGCHHQVARQNLKKNTSTVKDSAVPGKTVDTQKVFSSSEKKSSGTLNEFPREKHMAFVFEPETRIGESKESKTDKFFTSSFLTSPKKDEFITTTIKLQLLNFMILYPVILKRKAN